MELSRSFYNSFAVFLIAMCTFACGCDTNRNDNKKDAKMRGTFGYDMEFLSKYKKTIVLTKDKAMLAICPAYQGRVMTSTANGVDGLSFGWINYDLIHSGKILDRINPVGGEDRFWLGPEGGQYSIFFDPGTEFDLQFWRTPSVIDTEPFNVVSNDESSVIFAKKFEIKNYSGHVFELDVTREVSFLEKSELEDILSVPDHLDYVAYQSRNTITNIGSMPWTQGNGALSIWILGMFNPSPATTVIIPFKEGNEKELGPIVNDAYFGKVPSDRLVIGDGVLYFKGDGQYRSKIGLNPMRAIPYMGSYDEENGILTIVHYTKPQEARDYVNSMWEWQEEPFSGDVVNSYNDGPVDGSALGPFYELESSSPAAFLKVGESMTHTHTTIHVEGAESYIDAIVRLIFEVDLNTIKGIF